MKKLFIFLLVTVALALCCTHPVFAHGGTPRIEISAERLNPGATLEIRGVDFESEELITLSLIGSNIDIALGEVTADAEGGFIQVITLPADLLDGEYTIRAVMDDHDLTGPPFTVFGPAITNGEEGQREEDDPLLASMPTFAPGVVPNDVLSQPTSQSSQPLSQSSNEAGSISTLLIIMILLGVGILIGLGVRKMRQRK